MTFPKSLRRISTVPLLAAALCVTLPATATATPAADPPPPPPPMTAPVGMIAPLGTPGVDPVQLAYDAQQQFFAGLQPHIDAAVQQLAAAQHAIDSVAAELTQPVVTPYGGIGQGIPKTASPQPSNPGNITATTDANVAPQRRLEESAKPAVPQPATTPDKPLVVDGETLANLPIRPRIDGPNHHWKTDPLSMLLAAHPGPVLQRIAGSYFHAPDVPHEAYVAEGNDRILMGPSTPLFIDDAVCTLGVAGYDSEGNKIGITAGHCGKPGSEVVSADSWPMGTAGYVVAQSAKHDYSVIRFEDKVDVAKSYNGLTIDTLGWDDKPQMVCKYGVATGWTCGPQFLADQRTSLAQYCANTGDSGAPVFIGNKLIGVVSGGLAPGNSFACVSPLQGPLHAPAITHSIDAIVNDINTHHGYGAGFTLPTDDGLDPRIVTPDAADDNRN
ncbi:S1 family peptidase [Corynebacterium choanae]|nr:S1 family peptidase [Corynebacterium choanae]